MTVAELAQNALTVLIEPDPLITPSTLIGVLGGASDSTYTTAAPIPGPAVFRPTNTGTSPTLGTRSPDLRVVTSGSQATTQGVVVTRAGMPGEGCDVAAMLMVEGSPVWYGASQPQVIEAVSASVLSKGLDKDHNAAAVDTLDGYAVFVWADSSAVYARRYDPRTHAWAASAVTVVDPTVDMTADGAGFAVQPVVGVCRLRSGRLLIVTAVRTVSADLTLASYWSDDHGLTWRSASLSAVDTPITTTYAPDGLAVGYDPVRDAVLVVVTVDYGEVNDRTAGWAQYASTDLGASYTLVEWWGDGDTPAGPEPRHPVILARPAGGFVVACSQTSAADALVTRTIGSPHLPLRDADVVTILATGTAGAVPEWVTGWAASTGLLYLAAPSTTDDAIRLVLSRDGGATWAATTTHPYADPVGLPDRCLACPCRDVVVWAATDTALTAWSPQQLLLWESAGWQMLCQPRVAGGYPVELRGWGVDWIPWDHPQTLGWTLTGTTGTLATIGTPGLALPAGTTSQHVRNFATATLSSGAVVHAEVSDIVGDLSLQAVHIRLVLQTCGVEARMDAHHIRLWDSVAGAQIGSNHNMSSSGGHRWHVRLAAQGTRASLHVRRHDLTTWHLVASGTVGISGSPATSRAAWGHGTGITGSHRSTWHRVSYCENAGYGTLTAQTDSVASGQLLSRAWQSLPGALLPGPDARLPLLEGLTVHGTAGPGLRGESWLITVDDTRAAEHVVTRAVAERWESADTTAQRLAWEPAAGQAHHPGGHAVAVAVFDTNIRTATLQGWDGSAWVDVAALDLGLTGCAYTRSGDTVRPASGGTARPLLRAQDLAGASIILDGTYRRAVASATGGVWGTGSAPATLRLSGVTGAEPTSGTATILLTQGAAVRLGHVTGYSRWGLYIPSQNTVSGTFRIGRAVIGTAHVLGQQPSWGRVETREVQAETYEVPGLTRARRLARTRRRWSVAWVEGVISRRGQTQPSYTAAGGVGQVVAGDVSAIDALTDIYGAGLGQIAYLPRVAHTQGAGSAETILCLGRDACALVTLRGAPQVEQVLGQELEVELLRVSSVELEEEV